MPSKFGREMTLPPKPLSTFGSPIDDLELWRCAQLQLTLHGGLDAVIEANRRTYDIGAVGDRDGANTWMAIMLRILHLAPHRDSATVQ